MNTIALFDEFVNVDIIEKIGETKAAIARHDEEYQFSIALAREHLAKKWAAQGELERLQRLLARGG